MTEVEGKRGSRGHRDEGNVERKTCHKTLEGKRGACRKHVGVIVSHTGVKFEEGMGWDHLKEARCGNCSNIYSKERVQFTFYCTLTVCLHNNNVVKIPIKILVNIVVYINIYCNTQKH